MKRPLAQRLLTLTAALAVGALAGCAARSRHPISMLTEGLSYRQDPSDKDVLIYRNPNVQITSYSKFLIEPVKIFSNEDRAIRPEEKTRLADAFRAQLIDVLKSGNQIVDQPGPGVLRIRTAIQDIQPAHIQTDEERFLVLRLDTVLARVAMELEGVDSVSGEPVVALIHRLTDRRYYEEGTASRLLNVRDAFSIWTRSLRQRFDAARTRPGGADHAPSNGTRSLEQQEGD